MTVHVDTSEMRRVTRMIRESGDRELKKNFNRAVNEKVEPAKDAVRASAESVLPHRGGLARRVAGGKFRVQKLTGANPGVSLTMSLGKEHGGGKVDLKNLNAGSLRHPVFGTRKWVPQRVASGWWDRPLERLKPEIAQGVTAAVEEFARELARRSGQ